MRFPVYLLRESKTAGPYIPTSTECFVITGVILENTYGIALRMVGNSINSSLEINDVKFLAHKTLPDFASRA
jgi:hypothetical protein